MQNRIFVLNPLVKMPGHEQGDIVYQKDNGNYYWETAPFYEMAPLQVESFEGFFSEVKHTFSTNQEIYFVDSNGRIYKVPFEIEQHCSLVVYGNIFETLQEAVTFKRKFDRLASTGSSELVGIGELSLLRSLISVNNTEKAILFIDKIIEEINIQNGTNKTDNT